MTLVRYAYQNPYNISKVDEDYVYVVNRQCIAPLLCEMLCVVLMRENGRNF